MSTHLAEAEAAPLADGGRVLVPPIQLNVLDRVAKSQLIAAHAASDVALNFDDWQIVDQLLRVTEMRSFRDLKIVNVFKETYLRHCWLVVLIIKVVMLH